MCKKKRENSEQGSKKRCKKSFDFKESGNKRQGIFSGICALGVNPTRLQIWKLGGCISDSKNIPVYLNYVFACNEKAIEEVDLEHLKTLFSAL